MNQGKYVFAQLTEFLPRRVFDRIVKEHGGNKYVRSFTCWNQMLCMVFGQLTSRDSMRDLMLSLEAHRPKYYHLGFGTTVSRRNLGTANEKRSYKIFEGFAYVLIEEARKSCYRNDFEIDLEGNVYALDSTTIDLCLSVFWWAEFRKAKGGIKLHVLYDVMTSVPSFVHISNASLHDVNVLDIVPYEAGSFLPYGDINGLVDDLGRLPDLENDTVHPYDQVDRFQRPVPQCGYVAGDLFRDPRYRRCGHVEVIDLAYLFLDVAVAHALGVERYFHVLDAVDHVAPFGDDHGIEGRVSVPWHGNLRFPEGGAYLLFGMAVTGVFAFPLLMFFIVEVAVQLAVEHLLDAALLLQLLEKTVQLVTSLELLKEIVVEQFFFLHNVQIFKIRQKN